MSRLRIRHETGFRYDGDAATSYNEARMLPLGTDDQLVLRSELQILPPASQHAYIDYWGTRVLAFELLDTHEELSLAATSVVEVRARGRDPERGLSWDELAASVESRTSYVEQLDQSARTAPPDDLVALAREARQEASAPGDAALELARAIGGRISYMPGTTNVTSSAAEAWSAGTGVCQDIAHVTVGALRAIGIPARYVSGYLHPDPDAAIGETVTGESHAWVEWYCGEWRGFDPTNLIGIGERHVRVGHGRDYDDVPPLRGVYAGTERSRLFVEVEITREA